MGKCLYCGRRITDNMKFCPFCGEQLIESAKRTSVIQREDVDNAIKNKDFDFIWEQILYRNNLYAEYRYEFFYMNIIRKVNSKEMFLYSAKKIIEYTQQGHLYPKYLLGLAMMDAFRERGLLEGNWGMHSQSKYEQGKRFIEEACEQKQPSAMVEVGVWYRWGRNNYVQNEIKAFRLIKYAANLKHPAALSILAGAYTKGEMGLQKNKELGDQFTEEAAFWGSKSAQKRFGECEFDEPQDFAVSELAKKYKDKLGNDYFVKPYEVEQKPEIV